MTDLYKKNQLIDVFAWLLSLVALLYCLREFTTIFFTGNQTQTMDRVFEFSGAIEAFILFQSAFMLFKKRASFHWISFFAVLSIIIEEFLFFEEILPHGLSSLGLGNLYENHQEPRSWLFVICFVIHLINLGLPSKRSFERILTTLMLGATICTSFLFHKNFISGAMRDHEKVYTQMFSDFNIDQNFNSVCNTGKYNCVVVRNNEIIKHSGDDLINIRPYLHKNHLLNFVYKEHSMSGLFNTPSTMQNYFIYMKKVGDTVFAIYDFKNFHVFKRWLIIYFFRINIAAHFFWAFFTVGLIFFHRRLKESPSLLAFFKTQF